MEGGAEGEQPFREWMRRHLQSLVDFRCFGFAGNESGGVEAETALLSFRTVSLANVDTWSTWAACLTVTLHPMNSYWPLPFAVLVKVRPSSSCWCNTALRSMGHSEKVCLARTDGCVGYSFVALCWVMSNVWNGCSSGRVSPDTVSRIAVTAQNGPHSRLIFKNRQNLLVCLTDKILSNFRSA